MHGAQTIALAPLSDPETTALVSQLLGPDPSVGGVATMIAERAAGNPFFAEEIVRDLAERRVLRGNRITGESTADAAGLSVLTERHRWPFRLASGAKAQAQRLSSVRGSAAASSKPWVLIQSLRSW